MGRLPFLIPSHFVEKFKRFHNDGEDLVLNGEIKREQIVFYSDFCSRLDSSIDQKRLEMKIPRLKFV